MLRWVAHGRIVQGPDTVHRWRTAGVLTAIHAPRSGARYVISVSALPPSTKDFMVSAMNVRGFGNALAAVRRKDEVLARMPAESRAAYLAPQSARWHPGQYAIDVWAATRAAGGQALLDDTNYRFFTDSLSPIVRPVVKVALALSGASPATLFAKVGDIVHMAMRGLEFGWTPSGPKAGAFTVHYPRPVPAELLGWRQVMRVGSDMTNTTIVVDNFAAESDRQYRYDVHW